MSNVLRAEEEESKQTSVVCDEHCRYYYQLYRTLGTLTSSKLQKFLPSKARSSVMSTCAPRTCTCNFQSTIVRSKRCYKCTSTYSVKPTERFEHWMRTNSLKRDKTTWSPIYLPFLLARHEHNQMFEKNKLNRKKTFLMLHTLKLPSSFQWQLYVTIVIEVSDTWPRIP